MTSGEKIRDARLKAGYTQEQTASALKIPQSQISKWESGERCPKFISLRKLATLFNCNIIDLIDD